MAKRFRKKLNHGLGKAIHDWSMIQDKDRILVGVSGGKDSITLLHLLFDLKKKAPVSFDLIPVHIDPGFEPSFAEELKAYVDDHYGDLLVEYTDIGIKAHEEGNRENPCFLCAWFRRKRMFQMAEEKGCQKIALGHNKDDLIETLFLNMFYSGKMGTMKPKQSFFSESLDIIRPLAYVEEKEIITFSRRLELPTFKNPCPSAGVTKRGEIRQMLDGLYKGNKNIKGNIFRAMGNVGREYLLETPS